MARARSLALAGLAVAAAGCGDAPPAELDGLWSANQAACAAGVGVRFTADAIEAVYARQRETLFEHPQYDVIGQGDDFRVRITYALPRMAGGAHDPGAHGVLVLARSGDGGVAPAMHNLVDGRTGAARLRIADDPARSVLTLRPCAAHPWDDQGLRGRAAV